MLNSRLIFLNNRICENIVALLEKKSISESFEKIIAAKLSEKEDENISNHFSEIDHQLTNEDDKLILLLALTRYLYPVILNKFRSVQLQFPDLQFIGGRIGEADKCFIPTVRTALFTIAGIDYGRQQEIIRNSFRHDSDLFRLNILKTFGADPLMEDTSLECTPEFLHKITTGEDYEYNFTSDFPASIVKPRETWDDLVLSYDQLEKINDLKLAAAHHQRLLDHPGFGYRFKKNIIALFTGDPGTGKTLTAGLLGQYLDLPVYKIDLSRIVSKWVGETTKNLRNLFDIAENKNWILFFDEADSIFGKRTQGSGQSNDQYHNQDISYLLQRIDSYNGFIILSTNLSSNMDKAFNRRIDHEIIFRVPDKEIRKKLWENAFSKANLSFKNSPQKQKPTRHDFLSGGWDDHDIGINLSEIADFWDNATGATINKVMKRLLIESYENNKTELPSSVVYKAIYTELGIPRI